MLARLISLLLAVTALAFATPAEAEARTTKPNVVLIYVDDMRADDLAYMDFTRSLFEANGTTFSNAISPHPLCCPARAELMTGQYAQNNGVYHNRGAFGGYDALVNTGMTRLTPQWFNSDGYDTAYIGKYLNGYDGGDIPGADVTDTLVGNVYSPMNFKTWNDGDVTDRDKHTTDWTGFRTSGLISKFAGGDPFFITAAYLAPHAMKRDGDWVPPYRAMAEPVPMPIPPARYKRLDAGDEVPPSFSSPAYNEADMSDKPSMVRSRAKIDDETIRAMHQGRVLSLYAVDDNVRRTVTALQNAGVYNNTILAFTSDNGYLMGEHRIKDKDQPYQQSLRVPFMVTGPGVPVGVNDNIVTTVDIPGTLAALAGVAPNRTQDGINAFTSTPNRAVLIQSGNDDARWDWRGVYTRRYTYVEHSTGEVEVYDRTTDSHELDSNPGLPERPQLANLLDSLRSCRGASCNTTY